MDARIIALDQLVTEIGKLPEDWHRSGSVGEQVLSAIVTHTANRPIFHSLETGSGKTTLLLSHLSADHKVFALEFYGEYSTESVSKTRTSPVLRRETVEFIEGPTQLTLPRYEFSHKLQLAVLDGPHGYPFPDLEYFYIYPQLEENALLIVDDIHIPTIRHLFDFLHEDEMFTLVQVVAESAYFRRTDAPVFPTLLDGWWLQNYNKKRFPVPVKPVQPSPSSSLKALLPEPLKRLGRQVLKRN